MKTFEELKKASSQDDHQARTDYFINNYDEIIEGFAQLDDKQLVYIWDRIYWYRSVMLKYASFLNTQKRLFKQPVVEKILDYYADDSEVLNQLIDLYIFYICSWSTRCISSLRAGLKIDNLTEALIKELKKAKPTAKGDILNNLFAVMTKEEITKLVEEELKTASGEYKSDLLFTKLKIDNAIPLNIEIPHAPAIPEQRKITPEKTQELIEKLKKEDEDGYNKWLKNGIDFADCFQLLNNFHLTDKEREIVAKRNKQDNEHNPFFTMVGGDLYDFREIITELEPELYLWINYSIRMTYCDQSDGKLKYTLRYLAFDDNDFSTLPEFQDLRQIAGILKGQTIVDIIKDIPLYVASSIRFDNKIDQPEKYWPFFAENYHLLDYALDMFKGSLNAPMATTTLLHILDSFPTLPQRYIYPVLEIAINSTGEGFKAFSILRKVPGLKQILTDIKPIFNNKKQALIDNYLDELNIEKYITPWRYFECKEGSANKFWNIRQNGTVYEVEYGAIGKAARENFKEYDSMKKCKAEIEKIIAKKIKEGYKEVEAKEKPEEEKVQIDINQPILKIDGTPYSCYLPERNEDDDYYILTDTKDAEYMKATIQQLIKTVNKKTDDWFPNIVETKKGKIESLKDNSNGYPHPFHTFTRIAYKKKELHPWLEALLEAIIEYNGKGDNFDLLQLDDEWLAGTHLAFILGQNPKNRMLFIRFMRSINKADNHTAYMDAYNEVKLPEKTDLHFHAAYCATSTCCADFEPDIYDFEQWPVKKQNMMLDFMREEVNYLQNELRYMSSTLENFLGTYFGYMFEEKDTNEIARKFMIHKQATGKITVDILLN